MLAPRKHVKSLLQATGLLDPAKALRAKVFDAVEPALEWAWQWNERAYRRPVHSSPGERRRPEASALVASLRRDGIVRLPGFVGGERLARIQAGMDRMVGDLVTAPPAPTVIPSIKPVPSILGLRKTWPGFPEYINDTANAEVFTYDPFRLVPELLDLALDEVLLDVVQGYFEKPAMMCIAVADRCYPLQPRDFSSFQWHHDGHGPKLNLMVLLTDVTEQDQRMAYLKGTHGFFHSRLRTAVNSRFTEEEVRALPQKEQMLLTGVAGTAFLFDANGLHRGNRSLGATRDVMITCYSAGKSWFPMSVPSRARESLSVEQRRFLERNPRVTYV